MILHFAFHNNLYKLTKKLLSEYLLGILSSFFTYLLTFDYIFVVF